MIRWGILATGGIARQFTKDLAYVDDAEVVAVGSRSPEAAERFATAHGIPRAYGSWAELAADPEVDVVYVAGPHSAHHAATLLLLNAGRAVLCEKPITLNLAQARELVDLARSRGLFLMEAMWTHCNPVILRMAELIADGAIGEVRALHADFGIIAPTDAAHRLRNPNLGGGALLDLGVYPISLAHLILGAPSAISAWATLTPDGVDENTGILLGYESGAVATLSCSFVSYGLNIATVTGTAGRIELPDGFMNPDHLRLYRHGAATEEFRPPHSPGVGYHHEAAEVMRCLRAGETESPLVPLDRSLAIMSTMDTIRSRIGVHYPDE